MTILKPPGEFGCDVAVGCAQRFGVPCGELLKREISQRAYGDMELMSSSVELDICKWAHWMKINYMPVPDGTRYL